MLVASAMVGVRDAVIPVRLLNLSSEPKLLREDADTATFDPVDSVMTMGSQSQVEFRELLATRTVTSARPLWKSQNT